MPVLRTPLERSKNQHVERALHELHAVWKGVFLGHVGDNLLHWVVEGLLLIAEWRARQRQALLPTDHRWQWAATAQGRRSPTRIDTGAITAWPHDRYRRQAAGTQATRRSRGSCARFTERSELCKAQRASPTRVARNAK